MLVLQSLVFGVFSTLVFVFANFLWRRRRLYHLAAKIPGPTGLPLIGMGHKFINSDFKKIFDVLMTISEGYKSIMKIWVGPELLIFADTPESLQIVLNSQKCLDKSSLYDVLVLNQGLVIGGGEMWKAHRKILNPSFSINVLQQLVPGFDEKSKIFVKNLENKVGMKEFDIYGYISACSLETLLRGTMETNRDIQSNPLNNEYIHHIEKSSGILMSKMLNILYHFEPLYRMTNLRQLEYKHFHRGVLTLADEILDEKRTAQVKFYEEKVSIEDDGYINKPKTFISTLLNPKNKLSEQELKDEINTLIAAGHETSALVISEALLMLAMHPEVQRKVVQELKEVYETEDAAIDCNSLNKLVYLDMVVKETMRLFPVLPVSARKASGEFQIGDYMIPTDATIVICAFKVQRDKRFWGEDADKFRPERFEPENFKNIHPYAYIPFTGGPRICIGWRYGMLFMKSVLANFFRKYEASTSLKYEDLIFEMRLTLKIVQQTMIALKKRNF